MWAGYPFGTFSPLVPVGVSHCGFYLCVCSEESFFFFFLLLYSSWDVDTAKMRGYRSARVPEVCIEFRSRII